MEKTIINIVRPSTISPSRPYFTRDFVVFGIDRFRMMRCAVEWNFGGSANHSFIIIIFTNAAVPRVIHINHKYMVRLCSALRPLLLLLLLLLLVINTRTHRAPSIHPSIQAARQPSVHTHIRIQLNY